MQDTCATAAFTVPDFYRVAEQEGVPVVSLPLPKVGSLSLEDGDKGIIGIDDSRHMSVGEEQARIGHELGHCIYGGFYSRSTPFDLAEKHEVRADRWYIRNAIPRDVLFELLRKGYNTWEIAEMLNTTEKYVSMAYYYYKENG